MTRMIIIMEVHAKRQLFNMSTKNIVKQILLNVLIKSNSYDT